jgi:transcription elongation factor Elf1
MNITDRLAETILAEQHPKDICIRCGNNKTAGTQLLILNGRAMRLCSACVTDFEFFMSTPPPTDDTVSPNS